MEQKILDYVPIPLILLRRGPDGRFRCVKMNAAAQGLSGLVSHDATGMRPGELFAGPAGVILEAECERAASDGIRRDFALALSGAAGRRPLDCRVSPVAEAEAVGQVIVTLVDCPARPGAERPVMTGEAERFVAMAAHDLRTPMRHVQGIAEMLREECVESGLLRPDLIDLLDEVAARASSLIADVLAHARATDLCESRETFDVGALCQDIFTVLNPCRRHRLTCEPVSIRADRAALQIVLRNLIDNSLKHAGRRHVRLHVVLCAADDGTGMLEFLVRDNGRGFDDPGIAFLGGGDLRCDSGFGLLGVRRLIAARGGTIRVQPPASGRGAEIRFTLPGHRARPAEVLASGTLVPNAA